jgi:propionyl-CoA synthetase
VVYEGKPVDTPDSANFWRTIERHRINCLFTAPTALRAIKRNDPEGKEAKNFNLKSLQSLFLAGEHADANTIHWAEKSLSCPVIDNWWQTETGWPICANQFGVHGLLPFKHGSCFKRCPGYDLKVLDNNYNEVPPGNLGNLAIKLPLPPGALLSIWGNNDRFVEAYLKKIPGYYDTGDAGYIDDDDYVYVMTRTDDVINVAGHRLSTGQMEEVISEHPQVAEVAVIGVKDAFKGQLPLGLLVLNKGCDKEHAVILNEVVELVRNKIGPVAAFKQAVIVSKLPKTRSGKVLRATLRYFFY